MSRVKRLTRQRPFWCACIILVVMLVCACQPVTPEAAAPTTVVTATPTPAQGLAPVDPLAPEQAAPPVHLRIPEIGLDVSVVPMGWKVVRTAQGRVTQWDVPTDAAGWAINSAPAGAAGNTIIVGVQSGEQPVFAPLALGNVAVGQEILVTDADGITFAYRVEEVSEPIPITGATPEEAQQAAAYFAASDSPRLTLMTGWPDFTTTHRIFAVASFVGILQE